jgi:DNA-binding HxlR family transcriptional regulator
VSFLLLILVRRGEKGVTIPIYSLMERTATAIPDISHKMLTNTLKHLEEDHLIIRKAYAEIPPRVEYSLTETGKTLMPIIQQMIDWAQTHFDEVTK